MLTLGSGVWLYKAYAATETAVEAMTSEGTVADLLEPEALAGEETGRVNILVAGNSSDDIAHGGATLTDSIMVGSYEIATKQLTLISIPRDLYVTVDGQGMKLNALYVVGGMELLKEKVEEITGITLQHQVLINYGALSGVVDALGGIDVTIASSDSRGIYDPMLDFTIGSGVQHLNGAQALQLARARNDPTGDGRVAYGLANGDFDRMNNQRLIVAALLQKAATSTTLANSSALEELVASLAGNITSDLSVGQVRRMYDLSRQASVAATVSIRGSTEEVLLDDYYTVDGQAALIPVSGLEDYSAIRAYLTTLFD